MTSECKILENVCLKGLYRRMVFSAPEIAAKASPGQFVHIQIPELRDRILRRPFSISGYDPEQGTLTVTYKVVGAGTEVLAKLPPGVSCNIMGPQGNGYPMPSAEETPILVAGGYGSAATLPLALRAPGKGFLLLGARSTADLILYVADSSLPLDENDREIFHLIKEKKCVILLNKTDLARKTDEEDIRRICGENNMSGIPIVPVSAKEEEGMDLLEQTLKDMFYHGEISFNSEIYITSARQKHALESALESLEKVVESIEGGMPEDFYSIDLMDAYESLGSITGDTAGEDLVNEIFSKFCMGK